jgi:phospholipid/cholesterol/gamma-HCH transport system permease protein
VLDFGSAAELDRRVRKRLPGRGGRLVLDLGGLTDVDAAGSATLVNLWRAGQVQGFAAELTAVQPKVLGALQECRVAVELPPPVRPAGLFESLGDTTAGTLTALFDFVVLAADVTVSSVGTVLRPRRLRWPALLQQASLMGSQALGIVGLITFLIGLTLAFQSAYQLRQFGAAIYVATLTAISMVREMGPLITAILVAGRSGSSITSEVATMKVGEEIDAMQVMGIPFVDYIAVPKLLAMLVTVPLLTILADLLGILGGWIVGMVYLDIAPRPYLQKTIDALVTKDLATGLFKSVVFAWGIALIGLYYGAGVRGGAEEVGRATTASVVTAIFFIIIADSLFSILFYVVLG